MHKKTSSQNDISPNRNNFSIVLLVTNITSRSWSQKLSWWRYSCQTKVEWNLLYLIFLLLLSDWIPRVLPLGKILRPDQKREIYGADNFPPPYHDQISSSYSTEAEPLNVKYTTSPEEGWGVLLFLTKPPEMDEATGFSPSLKCLLEIISKIWISWKMKFQI